MATFDLFSAAEDEHQLRPLAEFFRLRGVELRLCTRPEQVASDPALLACTRRALRNAGVPELTRDGREVIALWLDPETPPPAGWHSVDLRRWPGRSTDRVLGQLLRWLKNPVRGPFSQTVRQDQGTAAIHARRSQPRPGGWPGIRRPSNELLVVTGLLVLVLLLVWLLPGSPQQGAGSSPPQAVVGEQSGLPPPESAGAAAAQAAGDPDAAAMTGARGEADSSVAGAGVPVTGAGTVEETRLSTVAGQLLPAAVTWDLRNALEQFCAAATVPAARARYAALTAAARRRLRQYPCVPPPAAQFKVTADPWH